MVAMRATSVMLAMLAVAVATDLLTGSFFSWLTGAQGDTMPLKAEVVMRRE